MSLYLVLRLPRTKKDKDSILVVDDRPSKIAYFILCHKTDNNTSIIDLFFKEKVQLLSLPENNIVTNGNIKFLSHKHNKILLGFI